MAHDRIAGLVLAAASAAALSVIPASSGTAADRKPVFDLSAPGHKEWSSFAKKNTGNNPDFRGCDGGNVSPALRWSGPPAATKSFAIVLVDLSGSPPLGFVHWVAYDIAASKTGLNEGEASQPSNEFRSGKNGFGRVGYFGPCPPSGEKAHPYTFVLMATDLAPGTLTAGMTREDLAAALKGHIIGRTTLVLRAGG